MATDDWTGGRNVEDMLGQLFAFQTSTQKKAKSVPQARSKGTDDVAIRQSKDFTAKGKAEKKQKKLQSDAFNKLRFTRAGGARTKYGRWVFDIPANWADRVGGERGTSLKLNVDGNSFGDAQKKLIARGIPATVAKGFDAENTGVEPGKGAVKGNLVFLDDVPSKGTTSWASNVPTGIAAGKRGLNPFDDMDTPWAEREEGGAFQEGAPGTTASSIGEKAEALIAKLEAESAGGLGKPTLTPTGKGGNIVTWDEVGADGRGIVAGDVHKEVLQTGQNPGISNAGDVIRQQQAERDAQAEIDRQARVKTWEMEQSQSPPHDIDKDGFIGDPALGQKFTAAEVGEVSGMADVVPDAIDADITADAEAVIEGKTGVSGITSNMSSDQASMLAGALSGELNTDDLIAILSDPDFGALVTASPEAWQVVNPLLQIAIDETIRRDAAQQGIDLENIKGDFLLDQAEIQALGGLSQQAATNIRQQQAVSGASPFGAMLAARSDQRGDIKDLAAMQASGGFSEVDDMLKAQSLAASGGLAQEDVLGQRQLEAANNPWAAMELGAEQADISRIQRGGLTVDQQRDLAGAAGRAAGNPFGMTAQQQIDLQNQLARGGLQEAQMLTADQLALEGQRQRGGLGVEQYMESIRGGLTPEERLAEIRNTGYYNATRPAELQAAASGPYGYMQQQLGMGLNEQQRANVLGEVGQMQRGGLSVQERLAEIQAQGAPQQLSSYLNFIGNPAAVAAAQQGGFSPFGDFAQRTADAPTGTVPQEFAGLGNIGVGTPATPAFTAPPEFTGLPGTSPYAGGLQEDPTVGDLENISQNQQQAALGEYAMQGFAPDEVAKKARSATPGGPEMTRRYV